MVDSVRVEIPEPCQSLNSSIIDSLKVERKQEAELDLDSSTGALSKNTENETMDMGKQTSNTLPARPKPQEKVNSYFEERKDRPGTRRWMSILHRNLAANPGSSHHVP